LKIITCTEYCALLCCGSQFINKAHRHAGQNKGHFILTRSAAGRMPIKGSIYGATKWFAYRFGQNLAEEILVCFVYLVSKVNHT
jgi:short-subunit dehydrogenase